MMARNNQGVCYICGMQLRRDQVVTLLIPKEDQTPKIAHLYCYALIRRRDQKKQQQRQALPPS